MVGGAKSPPAGESASVAASSIDQPAPAPAVIVLKSSVPAAERLRSSEQKSPPKSEQLTSVDTRFGISTSRCLAGQGGRWLLLRVCSLGMDPGRNSAPDVMIRLCHLQVTEFEATDAADDRIRRQLLTFQAAAVAHFSTGGFCSFERSRSAAGTLAPARWSGARPSAVPSSGRSLNGRHRSLPDPSRSDRETVLDTAHSPVRRCAPLAAPTDAANSGGAHRSRRHSARHGRRLPETPRAVMRSP